MRREVVVMALLLAGACSSTPPSREPVAAPRVTTRVRYQLGGPLRGEDAQGQPLDASAFESARCLSLEVSVVAVVAMPNLPLAAVIERAKLVVLEGAAERALAATPRRLATARVGAIDSPANVENQLVTAGKKPGRLLRSIRACLPAGASVLVELARDDASSREDAFARRTSASVVVGRRADDTGLDAALELEDPKQGGELVSIDGPAFEKPGVASWAAVLPSPFDGEEPRALVFLVATAPGPLGAQPGAAAHEEAIAEAKRDLVAQGAASTQRAARSAQKVPLPDLAASARALEQPATARRALYALATATGSRLAEELSVTVDDLGFLPIASCVAAALGSATRTEARDVGLVVEKAALASCREVLLSDDVPDDLLAALERRGGAALRLLPSLGGELDRARTLEDLEKTLETQNIQLLEDASPKIRVRAARWLERRIDLMGYVALDAAADAKTAAARRREVVAQIREKRARP